MMALLLLAACATPLKAAPHEQRAEVKKAVISYSALRAGSRAEAAVVVEIQDGFHAQSHKPLDENYIKFDLKLNPTPGLKFGEPKFPAGEVVNYPLLGKLSVYTGTVVVRVPIEVAADAKPGPVQITGKVRFQICDDKACYPPEAPGFKLQTEVVAADAAVVPNEPELFKSDDHPDRGGAPTTRSTTAGPPAGTPGASVDAPAASPAAAIELLTAFLVGIIFNAVPCVLPVLPLKAIGFYNAAENSRLKSLSFGLAFSLGLIVTFAVFGILIFGYTWVGFHERPFDWGQLFTKWWFRNGMVVILLAMAAGTFGAFNFTIPRGLYSVSPRHDTYWGNFLFGILTALLSTPCTFGMFVGLLAWAITQPPAIGVLMLVIVGAGMAFPYFLLSGLPEVARRFPRTGPWAELVKQMMGFLLLIAAVYFARTAIGRFVHGEAFWWLEYGVVVAAAIFLVARTYQYARSPLATAVGLALAAAIIFGPLPAVLRLTAQPFVWQPYSAAALGEARGSNRIALVEFTADWCGNCQYLEAKVLHSAPVVRTVGEHRVVMLKADVTSDDAPARPLLEQLNPAGSIPLTVIYGPGRSNPIELAGIYSQDDLRRAIDLAAEGRPTAVAER